MPFEQSGICDLSLSTNFDQKTLHVVQKLGYQTVAFDKRIDESVFESKKKTKKGETNPVADLVPEPMTISKDTPAGLTILHRLTVEFSDSNNIYKMNQSENLKKYDILAVTPTTTAAFQSACSTLDVDIICYNPINATNFKINRKQYKQAVSRGIHFEILYAPALKDSGYRKNVIQRAHLYHSVGKSANLLLSSGAENEFQIRGPYDVINIGLILALSEQQSKSILTTNTKKVLLKADNRRRGKVSIFILQKMNTCKRSLTIVEQDMTCKRLKTD